MKKLIVAAALLAAVLPRMAMAEPAAISVDSSDSDTGAFSLSFPAQTKDTWLYFIARTTDDADAPTSWSVSLPLQKITAGTTAANVTVRDYSAYQLLDRAFVLVDPANQTFTQYDYVESKGNAATMTGIKPDGTYAYELDFEITEDANSDDKVQRWLLCARYDSNGSSGILVLAARNNDKKFRFGYNAAHNKSGTVAPVAGTRYLATINRGTCLVKTSDGSTVLDVKVDDVDSFATRNELALSGCANGGVLQTENPANAKFYSFKVWKEAGGELLGDFVPAKQGDKVGFMNVVSNAFKYSELPDGGQFVAGNEVPLDRGAKYLGAFAAQSEVIVGVSDPVLTVGLTSCRGGSVFCPVTLEHVGFGNTADIFAELEEVGGETVCQTLAEGVRNGWSGELRFGGIKTSTSYQLRIVATNDLGYACEPVERTFESPDDMKVVYTLKGQTDAGSVSSIHGTNSGTNMPGTWTNDVGKTQIEPLAGYDYVMLDCPRVRTLENTDADPNAIEEFLGDSLTVKSEQSACELALKFARQFNSKPQPTEATSPLTYFRDLILEGGQVTLASIGCQGLAGTITVQGGYTGHLGYVVPTDSGARSFIVRSNIRGAGTVYFPINQTEITHYLCGTNDGFTGDVYIGGDAPLDVTSGPGTMIFATASAWFGDAGNVYIDGMSTVRFLESFAATTTNRTIQLGDGRPLIDVPRGVTVTLDSPLVGTAGFRKGGHGTLILTDSLVGLSGRIEVEAGRLQVPAAVYERQDLKIAKGELQELLDKGGDVVFPAGSYTIFDSLVIKSGTTLTATNVLITIADGADVPMLVNEHEDDLLVRDSDIVIRGVNFALDANGANQDRTNFKAWPRLGRAQTVLLSGIDRLTISGLVVSNQLDSAVQLADVTDFRVENLRFAQVTSMSGDKDGVRVCGPARNGILNDMILNSSDTSWCLVRLSADDGCCRGEGREPSACTIEDIVVEKVATPNTSSRKVISLESRFAAVSNVTIRSVATFGLADYGVVFSCAGGGTGATGGKGVFDNIAISNVAVKAMSRSSASGLICFGANTSDAVDVGTVRLENVTRTEPGDAVSNKIFTVYAAASSHIRHLELVNCAQVLEKYPEREFFGKSAQATVDELTVTDDPVADNTISVRPVKEKSERKTVKKTDLSGAVNAVATRYAGFNWTNLTETAVVNKLGVVFDLIDGTTSNVVKMLPVNFNWGFRGWQAASGGNQRNCLNISGENASQTLVSKLSPFNGWAMHPDSNRFNRVRFVPQMGFRTRTCTLTFDLSQLQVGSAVAGLSPGVACSVWRNGVRQGEEVLLTKLKTGAAATTSFAREIVNFAVGDTVDFVLRPQSEKGAGYDLTGVTVTLTEPSSSGVLVLVR